jgi:predicted nucleotidyltransferase
MIDGVFNVAFPGLARFRKDGVPGRAAALLTARSFVDAEYPNARCALMFGSFSNGNQGVFSDIDVMVILPTPIPGGKPTLKLSIYQGFRVETFLFDEASLVEAVAVQEKMGLRVLSTAIGEGIFLAGSPDLFQFFKRIAEEQANNRPPPQREIPAILRIRVTYLLAKLSITESHFDQILIASTLLSLMGNAVIKRTTGETPSGDRLFRALEQCAPDFGSRMRVAFMALCSGGGAADFAKIGEEFLEGAGGAVWCGETISLSGVS